MDLFYKTHRLMVVPFFLISLAYIKSNAQFATTTSLNPVTISGSAVTGEKPQSKVWTHDGKWWAVFPASNSTHLWRLDGTSWTNILTLTSGNAYADCKVWAT